MFPDFHYLFFKLFGIDIPALSLVKTFGFCVALAFLGGAWVLAKELKRKKEEGLFQPEIVTEISGKTASASELFWMGILGFVLGFKILGLILQASLVAQDPLGYILSAQGSLLGGLVGAALLVYLRYAEKKKRQTKEPVIQKVAYYPHQRVADIIFIAAIAGFAGAKVFNAFETWDDFLRNPVENLLSPSGLTFYGGLIVATIALYIYSRKKKFSFTRFCDAAAPALMLAYAIGRLGCQFAGDGDWGVYNSAYVTQADASLVKGDLNDFKNQVKQYPYAFKEFDSVIPQIYVPAPAGLPVWLYAQNFKNNVNNAGIPIAGDSGTYSHVLPVPVFPTSMYESIACFLLFLLLWAIRKRFKYPLQLFGIYLILNGLERFFIEKIRVNYEYDWGFIHPTQAEIISVCLVIAGIVLFFIIRKKHHNDPLPSGQTG
jgi:prolipoprotein diacylglyceryl transferase